MPKIKNLRLPCCICENPDPHSYELLYRLPRGEVIQCSRCSLVYVNDIPPKSDDQGDSYFDYWGMNVYEESERLFYEEFQQALEEINGLKSPPGKLLDVGCGPGYFLTVSRRYGWDPVGLDISKGAVNLARKRGETAFDCTVEELASKYPEGAFDCITLFNILEHLTYPASALFAVKKLLGKSGVVVIETPTEDSLIRRIAHRAYRLSGGRVDHLTRQLYHCGGHHFGFSRRTISMLLAHQGFQVAHIQPVLSSPRIALNKRKVELTKAQRPGEKLLQFLLIGSISLAWLGSAVLGPQRVANRMRVLARPKNP
ncbi:MAG: class I SAM-dependent methyltransferase [bacterium]